jgi:hypothetical protein
MRRRTERLSVRITPQTAAVIAAIAEAREGLSVSRVVDNAIELYGRKVLGRRMADLVPPRARPDRAPKGTMRG